MERKPQIKNSKKGKNCTIDGHKMIFLSILPYEIFFERDSTQCPILVPEQFFLNPQHA